jgi:hypothetical protein
MYHLIAYYRMPEMQGLTRGSVVVQAQVYSTSNRNEYQTNNKLRGP